VPKKAEFPRLFLLEMIASGRPQHTGGAVVALHDAGEGAGKRHGQVVTALTTQARQLPSALRRSITWDRGMELAQHKQLAIGTKAQIYFCDPQSP
jgi:hypothetical protein